MGSIAQEVSEEKNFRVLPRDFLKCLVKKVSAFCPCLKILSEVKVKKFGLIPLVEEISKRPSIVFLCFMFFE